MPDAFYNFFLTPKLYTFTNPLFKQYHMCLIFFALKKHPAYKLIVASNRDEFYNRKTAAAGFWEDHPDILGGRDLEACGTWMAMTRSG
jgi:uncharacterized protein with NRDE domain